MMNEDLTRETLVLEGQTWVQCENPKCLKWRAICRLHAASLGPEEPWYCYLNPNVAERDCRVPAGPQPSRQDLKRSKLTYVYSEHVEGSLVVAKLLGYPRWPAIISADTASGEYVSKNERGVVESYHVTFLGHPRTVSWIKIQDVQPFGKIGLQVKGADKFARWWKCAMKEANGLRSMSLEERLKRCTDPDVLCSDTLLPEKKNRKSKKQRLRVSSLDEKRFQEEVCMLLKQKNLEPICSPLQGRRLSLLLLYQEVCLAGGYTEVEKRQSKWNDIHKKLIGWKSVFGGKELSTYYRRVLLPYEKLKNGSRRTENEYSARQVEDGEYVSAEERENELDFNMADILMEQANSIFGGMPRCVNSENVSREPHQGTNQQLLPSEAKNYDSSEESNSRRHLINYCKNTGMHCVKAKARLTNIDSRVGKKKRVVET